jgi:hypothetical protein
MRRLMRRGEPAPADATVIFRADELDPEVLVADALSVASVPRPRYATRHALSLRGGTRRRVVVRCGSDSCLLAPVSYRRAGNVRFVSRARAHRRKRFARMVVGRLTSPVVDPCVSEEPPSRRAVSRVT